MGTKKARSNWLRALFRQSCYCRVDMDHTALAQRESGLDGTVYLFRNFVGIRHQRAGIDFLCRASGVPEQPLLHGNADRGDPHGQIVCEASKVVPVDKLSVVITLALAFVFLREEFTAKSLLGCVLIGAGALVMVL